MRHLVRRATFIFGILTCTTLHAQLDQVWVDYTFDYPFANRYLAEVEAAYQTSTSEVGKWSSYTLTPDFEVNLTPRFDLISQLVLSYTNQTSTYNTFEVRPILSGKYYFSPGKRVDVRGVFRYEHRMFHEIDIDNWIITNRTRLQGEVLIPINKPSIYNDKMFYGQLDAEYFFVMDQNVKERYASQVFVRTGLGYRLTYNFRFEVFVLFQSSRNEFTGTETTQEILRFRVKHYLNKATPGK